jgi:hypothetical protein
MFSQNGFCDDSSNTTGLGQPKDQRDEMDDENE